LGLVGSAAPRDRVEGCPENRIRPEQEASLSWRKEGAQDFRQGPSLQIRNFRFCALGLEDLRKLGERFVEALEGCAGAANLEETLGQIAPDRDFVLVEAKLAK